MRWEVARLFRKICHHSDKPVSSYLPIQLPQLKDGCFFAAVKCRKYRASPRYYALLRDSKVFYGLENYYGFKQLKFSRLVTNILVTSLPSQSGSTSCLFFSQRIPKIIENLVLEKQHLVFEAC